MTNRTKSRGVFPGRRVVVTGTREGDRGQEDLIGTVLQLLEGDHYLLLLDRAAGVPHPASAFLRKHPDPRVQAASVRVDVQPASRIRPVPFDHSFADYMKYAPEFLGVCFSEPTRVDSVIFPDGAAGRLVSLGPDKASVSWVNFTSPHLSTHSFGGAKYPNGYYICPSSLLKMCFLHKNEPIITFGNLGEPEPDPLRSGEIVFYNHPSEVRQESGSLFFQEVLMVEQTAGSIVLVRPVPVNPRSEGKAGLFKVARTKLERFPHTWLPYGTKVLIGTETLFRKRDLQGCKATVIAPTDLEGDVGLQFAENIGAGSLDGLGEDGKCLYIPADRLKVQT